MDGKLRVKTGLKIEVNDEGDFIVLYVEDAGFIERFYGIVSAFEKVSQDMEDAENRQLSEKEQLSLVIEKTKLIMEKIDGLFGEDTCKKVFGDIIPSAYAIADFFEQLLPVFNQYADERQRKLKEKYSGARKGSRGSHV